MSAFADGRHDRTLRLMQHAFVWTVRPEFDALIDLATQTRVAVRLPAEGRPQDQLALLALVNVVGRLPVGTLRLVISEKPLATELLPYRGSDLAGAVDDISSRLAIAPDIEMAAPSNEWTITITTPSESTTWGIAVEGATAYLGQGRPRSSDAFDPVGCYTLASMVGGEILRAWARAAAATSAGRSGPHFEARAASASDRWLDLHHGQRRETQQALPTEAQPAIDWVSCGAVNQAALAVLAAHPAIRLAGTVFDPGLLDAPDLNRSLLSFPDDLGSSKAQIGAAAVRGLDWRPGRYPDVLDAAAAPWIVCGTDDPSVRPACQALWPQRLIVTATEDVFGYAAWHSGDADGTFCAGCQPAPQLDDNDPIPTSAPTSVITGVAAAALVLRLAAGDETAHRTDLLTLRLDSPFVIERSNPERSPDCATCSDRAA